MSADSWCSAGDVEVENLRGRRRMQRVSSESCWRRGLPGTTVRGLTARCSEINGHGRWLCEKDAPESCRTSWSAHDDRRGVSAAMGSKVSGESYDCSAPLLPVFELRMRRCASRLKKNSSARRNAQWASHSSVYKTVGRGRADPGCQSYRLIPMSNTRNQSAVINGNV